jgi:two-component system NtrC family response regulator
MEKLLIIDDSEEIRKQLKWGLSKEYSLFLAQDAEEALSLFKKHKPKVVTLDLGLSPDEGGAEIGLQCLDNIININSLTKVIVITGNDERNNAFRAVRKGAYDYYRKPIDLSELRVIISRAFHLYNIENENKKLHAELEKKTLKFGAMVGQCAEMVEVFSIIRKIAPSDVCVLIQGESGTGKELVAKALHSMSPRSEGPFFAINCGAIPENLLESELFGHEKGAFTGALIQVQGKVEYAHGGTLFLDEISELPLNLQVKLLRFLQEKTIQRVGGREEIYVDSRIIAATNTDIIAATQEGKFREDLYYRVGVITVKLPPLRERQGDVMLLANLFLQSFCERFGRKIRGFSLSALDVLKSYEWPGNVRELENRIQRAVIMAESSVVESGDLGFTDTLTTTRPTPLAAEIVTLREAKDKIEKELAVSAIARCAGNIAKAAELLGVSRPTLYDIIKKHNLSDVLVEG